MEVDMELTKKTTILLSPRQHARLLEVARRRGVSMGDLVRSACERVYGERGEDERLEAARRLTSMSLPVADPATMKQQSTGYDDESP
jgi:hypothetical protein